MGNKESTIREKWLGGRTADCVGLIKGYGWLDPATLTIGYGTNGMPDIGADSMYNNATVKGDMASMPDTPGLAVWHSGHIGVYIGNGEVIEAMGTSYGVVKNAAIRAELDGMARDTLHQLRITEFNMEHSIFKITSRATTLCAMRRISAHFMS